MQHVTGQSGDHFNYFFFFFFYCWGLTSHLSLCSRPTLKEHMHTAQIYMYTLQYNIWQHFLTHGQWHTCRLPHWWDQRLLEQTGSQYNLISGPISVAHIISSGHTYCQILMSFTVTVCVFILLTQSVGNEWSWPNLWPAVMRVCTYCSWVM